MVNRKRKRASNCLQVYYWFGLIEKLMTLGGWRLFPHPYAALSVCCAIQTVSVSPQQKSPSRIASFMRNNISYWGPDLETQSPRIFVRNLMESKLVALKADTWHMRTGHGVTWSHSVSLSHQFAYICRAGFGFYTETPHAGNALQSVNASI